MNSCQEDLRNVWETLGKDLKIFILESLPIADRLSFCQADRRISNFCRVNNLTGADETIKKWNPAGQLIDTKAKLADYISRGYDTVYSLVLNEEKFDYNEGYTQVEQNFPEFEEIKILDIIPGVEKGTQYYAQHNYHIFESRYHLAIPGLPPAKDSKIQILCFVLPGGENECPTIETYPVQEESDLDFIFDLVCEIHKNVDDLYFQSEKSTILEELRKHGEFIEEYKRMFIQELIVS